MMANTQNNNTNKINHNEKLIEIIKRYPYLYDTNHKKYSDTKKKDETWNEIGLQLEIPGKVCKKSWSLLRDSFRRAIKKHSDAAAAAGGDITNTNHKQWKYEDEMSFLLPYLKLKQEIKYEPNANASGAGGSGANNAANMCGETNNSVIQKMDYERENDGDAPPTANDDVDDFFVAMAATVKKFPLKDRAIAKAKVFQVLSEMEINLISNQMIQHHPSVPVPAAAGGTLSFPYFSNYTA